MTNKTDRAAVRVICDTCGAEGRAGEGAFGGIAEMIAFDPVPRRPQVGNWTPDQQRAFIVALAITGSPKRAGIAIGRDERGAMKLRSAKGGESFSAAWDMALNIHRERERAAERERQRARPAAPDAAWGGGGAGKRNREDEEADLDRQREEFLAAKVRISDRLLRARRLYLFAIRGDEAKRAAWEALCGPVDWDKAGAMEAQPNEPFAPNMREPDMLLSAEDGCLPELVDVGRDRGAEFSEAMDEVRETGAVDGPKMGRFCG